jgi:hypothetical protein
MSWQIWIVALALGAATAPPAVPPINAPELGELPDNNHQPALSGALEQLGTDSHALWDSDLSTAERTRLALRIRALGERLPGLTVGQPPAVQRSAFELDRISGRLLAAVARDDGEAVTRESEAIAAEITRLRAVLGS